MTTCWTEKTPCEVQKGNNVLVALGCFLGALLDQDPFEAPHQGGGTPPLVAKRALNPKENSPKMPPGPLSPSFLKPPCAFKSQSGLNHTNYWGAAHIVTIFQSPSTLKGF